MSGVVTKRRCAVYTRKSSEEGLEMEFNSLDAQREACEAYAVSQKSEGWLLVSDRYDDGGFSGGTIERPALKRLMEDIERGKIDIIVVYKIDRLSRSLTDFAKLVDVFDRNDVAFVSVTQPFNTATSMGRLVLNVLLSFAQFEREVIGERIRDKFAASRRKGMWMGGWTPFGYRVENRKLVIDVKEAPVVQRIFKRFTQCGSATMVVKELAAEDIVNRYGKRIDKGMLYKLLRNRVYIGDAVHKGTAYPGQHDAIIDLPLWDAVHAILKESPRSRAGRTRAQTPALLRGLIYGPTGSAMSPSHTRRRGRLYRYYTSQVALKHGADACPVRRVPAGPIEAAVITEIRKLLVQPEVTVAAFRAARSEIVGLTRADVRTALEQFDAVWDELFPAEQARIVQLLVDRVDVAPDGVHIRLRVDGFSRLVGEVRSGSDRQEAA